MARTKAVKPTHRAGVPTVEISKAAPPAMDAARIEPVHRLIK
jgi:hypothetical protein